MALTNYSNTVKTAIEWQKTINPKRLSEKLRPSPNPPNSLQPHKRRPKRKTANSSQNPLPNRRQPPSPATAFANTPEEIADRKTAAAAARKEEKKENRTERESGTENRLAAEAERIFAVYPDASVVYMTSNGFGFFKESEARNHANTLRDKAVITIKRK